MDRSARPRQLSWILGALLLFVALLGRAQEKPLSINGELVTGFASTSVDDGEERSRSVNPFHVKFDLTGYLGHPDFLSYRIEPQFTPSEEAPQAGFSGANGLSLKTTFLRRRAFPLTIRYANFRRELITFGSLQGVSGVRSVSRYSDFGLTWLLKVRNLPQLSLNYSASGSKTEPNLGILPVRETDSRRYGLRIKDFRWAWNITGTLNRTERSFDTASILDPDRIVFDTEQKADEATISAQRRFWGQNHLSLFAGRRVRHDVFDQVPFDQSSSFFRGAASLKWHPRWDASIAASYISNRDDIFRQPVLGLEDADPLSVFPFQSGVSTFSVSGQVRYKLSDHWMLSGGLDETRSRTTSDLGPAVAGSSHGVGAGIGFDRTFSWGQLTSSYGLSLTQSPSINATPDNRTTSHSISAQVRRGTPERLELIGNFSGNFNRVDSEIFLERRDLSGSLSLAKRFGAYLMRGGFGLRKVDREEFVDFASDGWTAHIGVEHRLFNVQYGRGTSNATSLLLQRISQNGAAPTIVPGVPLRSILTLSSRDSLTFGFTPIQGLRGWLRWNRIHQTLDGQLRNDSNLLDLAVSYQFRLLEFDAGYTLYDQTLSTLAGISRGSFFFRVRRPFRVF